jgi:predicted PurR-regulated permease PerM
MDRETTANILLFILAVFVIGVTLKAGEPVLVPVLVSILLAYVMEVPTRLLRKLGLPLWLAVTLTALVIFGLAAWLVVLISLALADLAGSFQRYQEEIAAFLAGLEKALFDSSGIRVEMDVATILREMGLSPSLFRSARVAGGSVAVLVVIFVLATVTLYGKSRFPRKLLRAYPDRLDRRVPRILGRIDAQVRKYIGVKTLGSLLVGCVVAATTLAFGVRFVPIWAAVGFVLNFIPAVGPLVSSALPAIVSLLDPGNPMRALWVFGVLISLNMVIHNILEPKLQGHVLNLSLLVVFLSLLFWGWLWGHLGVLLAVPMTAAVKIVLESIPLTRSLAILMERPSRRRAARRPSR